MDLVFGLWADSGAIPDHAGKAGGSLGKPVVGPLALTEILETALGLGGPHKAHVVRIATFQATLENLKGSFFWSESLQVDPWATARVLLSWRDELIGFGWQPDVNWTEPRLAQLALASLEAVDLPMGLSDRIAVIIDALDSTPLPITRIRLIDAFAVLPSPLRRLMTRLGELSCSIEEIATQPAASADCSLGKLQRWMLGACDEIDGADGTVTIASCSSEPLAAEVIGQWFAVQNAQSIAIVAQGGDTDLLDHGMAGLGQPRAGRSRASVHRGSLQLLLLAFKTSWMPFDPRALMEILIFPNSPVAPRAARYLASALEQAPGRGDPEWENAWALITDAEHARSSIDDISETGNRRRLDRWRVWAEPVLADPEQGMPLELALAICDRVMNWAARLHATTGDLLYMATAKLSGEVRTALVSLGRERLPRLLIERVIDQALDVGKFNPGSMSEAASWRSTRHPGAIWAPVTAVVWWNFGATSEGSARSPWTEAERSELAAACCPVDDAMIAAQAASAAWERAIINARETVLLVTGGLDCEGDDHFHPLAHRIKPAFERLGTRVRLEAGLSSSDLSFAGATIGRVAIEPRDLPAQRASWSTPDGFAVKLEGVTESATSLESLFSCQLMWALRHVARVRPGRVRSIPDANQLLGNLAHAMAREIFQPGSPPTPDDAAQMTSDILEGQIDQLAAPLRHPELAEELNFARRRLPMSMAALARCLTENQLRIEATEQQVSGTFESLLALRGAVDLIARDSNGRAIIVDLKWTRSERSRIDELTSGRAVQLATYGALVSEREPYRAGYFLLNQRQFVTLTDNGLVGRPVDGARSFPETWDAIVAGYLTWRDAASSGKILATGVEGVTDQLPANLGIEREVRCDLCDYATLCRKEMA